MYEAEGEYFFQNKFLNPLLISLRPKLSAKRESVCGGGVSRAIEEDSLEKNNTWEFVDIKSLPRNTNILRSKFVFDIKRGAGGEFLKFKARMVAMGFTQVEGVDYEDTFASVMTTKSFRILLAIWNFDKNLSFEHWDVKTAFVNAPLQKWCTVGRFPVSKNPVMKNMFCF